MYIAPISPDHPGAALFIADLDDYQNSLYPAESNHLDSIEALKQPNVVMLGALDKKDSLMGMGAVKFVENYGEIKRMYVPESHRKKGIARRILHALEHLGAARGISTLCLETGIYQEAAIQLYSHAGFNSCGPFGAYPNDPLSVFMKKNLPGFSHLLSISPFREADRDQVVALWQRCGLTVQWNDPNKDIDRKMAEAPDLFLLARLRDQVIGTCMAGYDGHRGWFYYLGTAPEFRGNGVAAALVRRGESALAQLGCPKINLMVRKSNTEVLEFYKGQGYGDDPVLVLSKRL
ncbi:MAG: GNAT family acetyltransferase [Desulfobacter sp.]|nr:MAG: GNAT family acetyltransferase [Desulfobacter sp.]